MCWKIFPYSLRRYLRPRSHFFPIRTSGWRITYKSVCTPERIIINPFASFGRTYIIAQTYFSERGKFNFDWSYTWRIKCLTEWILLITRNFLHVFKKILSSRMFASNLWFKVFKICFVKWQGLRCPLTSFKMCQQIMAETVKAFINASKCDKKHYPGVI